MCQIVLIAIGNEVLKGQTLDTNTHFMAQLLTEAGFQVVEHVAIQDDKEAIQNAVGMGLRHADVVISTGGLGPTVDDLTADVAHTFSSDLTYFDNHVGLAKGIAVAHKEGEWLLVPGVPQEMREMMKRSILPHLQKKWPQIVAKSQYEVHVMMKGENEIAPHVQHLKGIGLYPSYGHVTVRFSDPDGVAILQETFGDLIYTSKDGSLEQAVHEVIGSRTLAVAESCTGGLIAHKITRIPGASQFFRGGVVSYSNRVKCDVLGVRETTLNHEGAVSKACVMEMAKGVAKLCQADYAIAVSGIAGPDGGTKEKPVGTVWGALYAQDECEARFIPICNPNLREIVIEQSSNVMLGWLYQKLRGS